MPNDLSYMVHDDQEDYQGSEKDLQSATDAAVQIARKKGTATITPVDDAKGKPLNRVPVMRLSTPAQIMQAVKKELSKAGLHEEPENMDAGKVDEAPEELKPKDDDKEMQKRLAAGQLPFKPDTASLQKSKDRSPKLEMGAGGGGGSVGSIGGPMGGQGPLGGRHKKVKEMLELNPDIKLEHVVMYVTSLDEGLAEVIGKQLDSLNYNFVAEAVREHVVRKLIEKKVREVVRKKSGGGGFVLYKPNPGKKGAAKAAQTFPTKIQAKRAELQRYPPKDPGKLARLRREIQRLSKDPKKAKDKEKEKAKKESLDFLNPLIESLVNESLFREERTGSEWDEHIGKLSKKALAGDKKFQQLQKNIEKKTEGILKDSLNTIKKALGKEVKVKDFGVKKSDERGKTYLAFSATIGNAAIEPIYIYVENGVPKIELSDQARVGLTKADADQAKMFRAELVTVQEGVLDEVEDLVRAIGQRDKYLDKVQDEVDGFIAELTPLQISLLKNLLVQKYRKLAQ